MLRKSFSLIETTFLLLILSLLTSAMVKMVQDYQKNSYSASAKSRLLALRSNVVSFVREHPYEVCAYKDDVESVFKADFSDHPVELSIECFSALGSGAAQWNDIADTSWSSLTDQQKDALKAKLGEIEEISIIYEIGTYDHSRTDPNDEDTATQVYENYARKIDTVFIVSS